MPYAETVATVRRTLNIEQLVIVVNAPLPDGQVNLASGRPVQTEKDGSATVFRFDLDVADMLVIRP